MKGDFDDVEVGFVNGLVELYNLRDRISKYKAEIISMWAISAIKHRHGIYLFNTKITFRSSWIENLLLYKRPGMDKE